MNLNISKILACLLLSIWTFCSTAQNIKISEVFYDTPYEEDDNDSINVSHNGEFIEICQGGVFSLNTDMHDNFLSNFQKALFSNQEKQPLYATKTPQKTEHLSFPIYFPI